MKVTLTFDTDIERKNLDLALSAPKLYLALLDVHDRLRAELKHGPLQPERELLEQLRRITSEALERVE